ncbi:hypothetical protein SLS57_011494 [Botryosphaeria dothidea]
MASRDLVIVGAGLYGLSMAKTYREIHPDADVVVLEVAMFLGGTWAKDRLYPGLKTNNLLGTYESPDFPMLTERYGVEPGQHIPGKVIHDYLRDYADHFNIYHLIEFNTKFEGSDSFNAPLFHTKDFFKNEEVLETSETVAVYGGAKSGWDAVYAYATSGVKVDWIMRESGRGPCWMAPPFVGPTKVWIEKVVFMRIFTWFSPCLWAYGDGYDFIRSFLHRTAFGRWLVDMFWNGLSNDVCKLNGYDKHPETKKLIPWSDGMWSGTSLSILNYPTDFFELVRNGMVRVHHADILRLSDHTVHLSHGGSLKADALHCCTGWRHEMPMQFSPASLVHDLGLPDPSGLWVSPHTAAADNEILTRFPRLKHQPNVRPKRTSAKPERSDNSASSFHLYRFMIPPQTTNDRNIAVAGAVLSLGNPTLAQIQALWLAAYFDGALRLPESTDKIEYSAELYARFGKWRSPAGYGDKHGDLAFETLPYYDELLRDLGLRFKRKGNWLKEAVAAYGPADYMGLVQEWLGSNRPTNGFHK